MAFGFMVNTPDGLADITYTRAARRAYAKRVRTTSGSLQIPDYRDYNTYVHCIVRDGKVPPARTISSTGLIRWFPFNNVNSPSSDMVFVYLKYT